MDATMLLLALAVSLFTADDPADIEPVAARYERECASGAAGPDCETLRAQLEDRLFDDLMLLGQAGQKVDRETLRTATRAESPWLAAYAVALLDDDFGPGDVPSVRAALDSPYPAVRAAAVDLSKWFETPELQAATQRAREALARYSSGGSPMIADSAPTAAGLGAPLYPGATYSFLAGSPDRPVFVTPDDPRKVEAFFGKGRPALSAEQMAEGVARREAEEQARHDAAGEESGPADLAAAMALAAKYMEAMNAGQDPTQAAMEMGRAQKAAFHDWTGDTVALHEIGEPRFVVVEEEDGIPLRVVAVYRDPALGATAIAYPEPPGGKAPDPELMTDGDAMVRWTRWQAILAE